MEVRNPDRAITPRIRAVGFRVRDHKEFSYLTMFDARVHWLQLKMNAVAAMLRGRNPLVEKPPCQTGNRWHLPELRRRFTEADWSRPAGAVVRSEGNTSDLQ